MHALDPIRYMKCDRCWSIGDIDCKDFTYKDSLGTELDEDFATVSIQNGSTLIRIISCSSCRDTVILEPNSYDLPIEETTDKFDRPLKIGDCAGMLWLIG